MPTLDDPPSQHRSRADVFGETTQRLTGAIGADSRVRLRALIAMVVAVVCVSMAPQPWAGIGVVALLLLALDWARRMQYPKP